MKKKSKFLFGAITTMLAVSVLGGTCLTASASEISIEEMREYLISMQFSEFYINSVPEEKVKYLFDLTQNHCLGRVERETGYLNETNNSEIMPLGPIYSTDLSYTISTHYYMNDNESNQTLWKVLVTIEYKWVKLPTYKLTDAVVINWDSNVFTYLSDSFFSYDYAEAYLLFVGNRKYEKSLDRPTSITQGGLGYNVFLRDQKGLEKLYGYANFELLPAKSPMHIGSSAQSYNSTSINAQYAHNWNVWKPSIGFSFSGPSISFSTTYHVDTTAVSTNVFYRY